MKKYIVDFHRAIIISEKKLLKINERKANEPYANGKWTRKEMLGHLIDSASNNHKRFVEAQFKDDLIFNGYNQDNYVGVQNYKKEKWEFLILLWKNYNLHLLHLIKNIPNNVLTLKKNNHNFDEICWQKLNKNSQTDLEYLVIDYIGHLKHHLAQILS